MVNLSVNITGTRVHPQAGVVFDHIQVDIKDAQGVIASQSLSDSGGLSISTSFSNVADGVLSYTVSAVDNKGNVIGTALTGTFDTSVGSFLSPTGVSFTVT